MGFPRNQSVGRFGEGEVGEHDGFVSSGPGSIITGGVLKIAAFIVIAPLLGMVMSYIISILVINLVKKHSPSGIDKHFRRLQLLSAAAFSLGHGGNDAQKSMGIIWIALITMGVASVDDKRPELWVVLSCQAAIALGTLFGGWRIVKTMGQRITKLRPFEGFCAEAAGALTLFGATHFGIPVSTTHTITGSIMGVGAIKGFSAVKWGVTTKIFWAWILTIPVSAVIGAIVFYVINAIY